MRMVVQVIGKAATAEMVLRGKTQECHTYMWMSILEQSEGSTRQLVAK